GLCSRYMERLQLTAYYAKTSLNLAKIEQKNADLPLFTLVRRERGLLLYQTGENRFVCVYSFGVIVFLGFGDKREIGKMLKRFSHADDGGATASDKAELEEYGVVVDEEQPEAVEFDFVRIRQLTVEKVMLICNVIAQSVAIDYLESQIQETMQKFEGIHNAMSQKGKLIANTRSVIKTLGASGNTVHFIINRLSLLDKPDIAWEDREAETMFIGLRKMFELEDRFGALRFKMDFIQSSSEVVLDVLQTRRAEFLEWIIIVLFVIEIVFALMGLA
ncbi:MAG: RMD1 family protein, partial [Patescibacteria group bacterium]|nr:RMD1 family protein [Patescibacteria group bacterium]